MNQIGLKLLNYSAVLLFEKLGPGKLVIVTREIRDKIFSYGNSSDR